MSINISKKNPIILCGKCKKEDSISSYQIEEISKKNTKDLISGLKFHIAHREGVLNTFDSLVNATSKALEFHNRQIFLHEEIIKQTDESYISYFSSSQEKNND